AGVPVPAHMLGRVFLGPEPDPEPDYVFAAADRHDEAHDHIRAVRDRRYKYIRNYRPDLPYGQPIRFRENLATMREIFRLHDEGLLAPPADWYYRATKPVEELYDTLVDPHELENLAASPQHQDVLLRMRAALDQWVQRTRDLGFVLEEELAERYWPGGVQPQTPPPLVSPQGGTFVDAVTVVLGAPVDGASIVWTLEQGDDVHWRLYHEPIVLTTSATLRARAVRYGWAESEEARACFVIGAAPSSCP